MPKTEKPNHAEFKPYFKPPLKLKQSKLDFAPARDGLTEVPKKSKKNEYDKTLLVILFLKTAKDIEWDELSKDMGKTPTQCKDTWRKVIHPSLLSNKPWSGGGRNWTGEMKIATLMMVLNSCNPDWEVIATSFPGKTKSQLYDVWRKVIFPRLKRGDTVE
ncbi:hypothetical protein I302_105200 [Kwoniella bestiolae CBS 10118]|uniref:Myb-like domain-containing protein n=1 Tax=Kwoniella bestiolae CBS 10118 TaxID=1296100 RepID=A0AAJ8K9F6_9TREE